ncbi:putative porin [Hymenobacter tibetensis]|uniref:Porin n=1 Tax=Hymenobacter tibetensis TaxID=497967 RepID=A0ABY4CRR5_9BACT|nr:putative porin [Hymenobacter tibetensis]UOG72913.1 putative porin [Hymenobacter tibetensis]
MIFKRWPFGHPTVLVARLGRCQWALLSILLFVLLGRAVPVQAQILDDSTKVLYGARTTRVIYEDDILRDRTEGRIIDTTLTNFPSSRNWYHDSTFYQDLGLVGTAARPLLWRTNTQLGYRLGRNVFDRYARDPATIPYYDTKSPYTFFRFIQGSFGEQVFELSYTRSINKNASVGLAYERFASNKLYNAISRSGLVEHTNFLLFARFQSTDERYRALFNYSNVRHQAAESGGAYYQAATTQQPADTVPEQLFGYDEEISRLTEAANTEHRDGIRFVQSYRLIGRGLTAYHIVDFRRQRNRFLDDFGRVPQGQASNRDLLFYPVALLSRAGTNDKAELRQVENTVGVLGRNELVNYRIYARHRGVSLSTHRRIEDPINPLPNDSEPYSNIFLGGTANFRYKIFAIETVGEYALPKPDQGSKFGEYWARGLARLGPLTGEVLISSYSPTLTQQQFSGNHYRWGQKFNEAKYTYDDGLGLKNTNVQQLTVRLDQTLGQHRLEASGAIVNITNLVYYNELGEPEQTSDPLGQRVLTASVRHRFNVGKLFFDNQAHATTGGEDDVEGIRIPGLITNSKIYYQGSVFKNALFGQIGAEVYYQSSWKPYDYSPSTQQFYVQNGFTAANFAVADAFLTADIRTVAVFLKVAYLNQGLQRDGFFVTPYYTTLPRRFQIGIRWQFFD